MTGGRVQAVFVVLGCVVFTCATAGCETYRVEYHRRPAFYKSAAVGQLEDRVTLEDGTVLVYSTRGESGTTGDRASGERFQIREELDDGVVILRAMLPQHVLANTMTCLRNQEYQLIWDQLLSKQTKHSYELHDQGYDQFAAFFAANRLELGATLTRMMLGLSRGESFMETLGGGVILFRFHSRIAVDFEFKTVKVIAEDGGLKLLIIE
jgi:hypothetical protein